MMAWHHHYRPDQDETERHWRNRYSKMHKDTSFDRVQHCKLKKCPKLNFRRQQPVPHLSKTIRALVNPSTTHFTLEARGIMSMEDCVHIRQLYMNTCCPHSTIDNP